MVDAAPSTLQVGDLFSKTISVWLKNFVPFAIISLIIYSPVFLLSWMAGTTGSMTMRLVISAVQQALGFVAAGAFTYGVVQSMRGKPVSTSACLTVGFSRLLPVLGVALLTGLLVGLGFICLIVPGIILQCMFAVAVPVAIIEKPGVTRSLGRSKELTQGHKVNIFLLYLLFGLISIGIGLLIGMLVLSMGIVGVVIGVAIVAVIGGAMGSTLPGVLYYELRRMKEGVSVEDIAKVFD